ncbi:MAG: carbamoyltransferase HypF, partial [Candidatus Aenigmarchaeota archaeon]|nr:carbamoyltransferase HypF [Candidatus Aenigmarchaeota archaeon]
VEKVDGSASFFNDFEILPSKKSSGATQILPDISVCDDCISDISDSKNRRKNYYYTTCTNCGPRFSIIENLPYDRSTTTMKEFVMCDSCKKEYQEHSNRRYHAQTIGCPDCGPELIFSVRGVKKSSGFDAIKEAANAIKKGKIIAIKGVGGYNLSCDAKNDKAVSSLRGMIKRPKKPLAVMIGNVLDIEKFALVSDGELSALTSYRKPIVVLEKKRKDSFYSVSPLDSIGVLLPYTALHHILLDLIKTPIVMTSCNLPGEPMDKEMQEFAEHDLSYNRKISNRVDDSVLKFVNGNSLFLRRSRGFAPEPIGVDIGDAPDMIALGSQESNTVSLYTKGKVYVSQHIGNTSNPKTFDFFKKCANFLMRMTGANPKIVLCDYHPDFYITHYAKELASSMGAKLVLVQHHTAHAYSVALENGLSSFVGIVCDGSGYGADGNIWGGEVFLADSKKTGQNVRVGHLEEQVLLGGDSSVIEPERMLFGILSKFLSENELKIMFGQNAEVWQKQIDMGFNVSKTTSCGRILDAASYFLGVCKKRTYEGEPAIALESFVSDAVPYDFKPVIENNVLQTTPLFKYLWENKNKDKKQLAATVHEYVARGLFEIAKKVAGDLPIVFSGGVAYNRHITKFM